MKRFRLAGSLALWLVAGLTGCGKPTDPYFVLNRRTEELIPEARTRVAKTVAEHFGTPVQLVAWQKLPINYGVWTGAVATGKEPSAGAVPVQFVEPPPQPLSGKWLQWVSGAHVGETARIQAYDAATGSLRVEPAGAAAAGEEFVVFQDQLGGTLKYGRDLYMQHCIHCHGVSGDGNGPTAQFLSPRPRDYRQGTFKFKSTAGKIRPSRADLLRTLQEGIPGTSMPSFVLLADKELHALIEYVRWLSMRGTFEIGLLNEMATMDVTQKAFRDAVAKSREGDGKSREDLLKEIREQLDSEFPEFLGNTSDDLADSWSKSDDAGNVVVPKLPRQPATAESLAAGKALYFAKKAKCADCHGLSARGDGSLTEDFWDVPNLTPAQKYPRPGLHDDWGQPIQPRNLTRGVYRGGRRPIDLYRRIYGGINGTPMPAFGGTVLTDEEIWDLVNYVMSIPFDGRAPEESQGSGAKHVAAARH